MKKWPQLLSVFTLGLFLGLAIMALYQMQTLDRLYGIQSQLTTELLDKEIKLERLNENIKKQSLIIVKDLDILVNYNGNPLVKDEIKKNIQFYLSDLVGRDLDSIDGVMIHKILQQRIIGIEDKHFKLLVDYIIISQKISVSVSAKLLE
ncbi:hypothetical protein [Alkaliphilus hydrothermalis]|uniref:Sporulation membrane protein YtrI C-terminal domain-containing protein n=1 Tax=Alkaliphilus hydrothermalis TaxID=1482730 RepID=A0ABS2NP83_9FIRM|nr:hypothetical protein [Alkaliphilus hydrothermalis]MBM7614761.1 hypothetical protein [Alkaliphilus hydrothermalis]